MHKLSHSLEGMQEQTLNGDTCKSPQVALFMRSHFVMINCEKSNRVGDECIAKKKKLTKKLEKILLIESNIEICILRRRLLIAYLLWNHYRKWCHKHHPPLVQNHLNGLSTYTLILSHFFGSN